MTNDTKGISADMLENLAPSGTSPTSPSPTSDDASGDGPVHVLGSQQQVTADTGGSETGVPNSGEAAVAMPQAPSSETAATAGGIRTGRSGSEAPDSGVREVHAASANQDGAASNRPTPNLATELGRWAAQSKLAVATVLILFLAALGGGTYFSWLKLLPDIVSWSNEKPWHWVVGWLGVFFTAFAPLYIVLFVGPVVSEMLAAQDKHDEGVALDELDHVEREIRGSKDPVDFARYSRKALKAYYLMGQSQVRVSFYVGVFAMLFGFLFLMVGLLAQVLDTSKIPYIRKDPVVETVALGGGLIIEFIAATFLFIYRASISQLNRYYRRQMLVHSALLSATLSERLEAPERSTTLSKIVGILVTPDQEVTFPQFPSRQPPSSLSDVSVVQMKGKRPSTTIEANAQGAS